MLLQMRTRVLNGELEQTFQDWHPGFRVEGDEKLKVGLASPGFAALLQQLMDFARIGKVRQII